MSGSSCSHPDVRKFDGVRCCLACGEVIFEESMPEVRTTTDSPITQIHHRYSTLKYDRSFEIRLAILYPGEYEDPVRVEIIHVNLKDEPDYEAVSYTWATENGDTRLSSDVTCHQGGSIKITKNCDAVLRQLRQRGLRRRIWIDTLCIDQDNIQERNHQVGLMDRIFSQARSVRLCVQDHSGPSKFSDYGQLFRSLQSYENHSIADPESPLFLVFVHLISLRYFQRAWVSQEAALARAAYLLVNNHELLLTPQVMDRLRQVCMQNKYRLPGVLRWDSGQKVEVDLLTCLRVGIECQTTDARDKVYALLGLMEPQTRSLIPVDYSLGVEAVYANAVIAIIILQQSLEVLLYSSVLWEPIFASDWNTASNMNVDQFRNFLFSTSISGQSHAEPKPNISAPNPRHLQFEGEDSIGPWKSTVNVKIEATPSQYNSQFELESESCIVERPQPGQHDVLPRLLVRAHHIDNVENVFLDAKRFAKAVLKDANVLQTEPYSQILPFFETDQEPPPQDFDVIIPLDLPLEQTQRYFPQINIPDLIAFVSTAATRDGCAIFLGSYSVGIAAHGSFQRGDAVFAIDGVKTPLLLRETNDHHFKILRPCYVHAGLELDYWNEGSRKGRWGRHFQGPRNRQTRMIEIN